MYKIKNYKSEPGYWFAEVAGAIGKGLMAGAAGTLAITLSQMIEMKITKRKPSTAPADAAGAPSALCAPPGPRLE